MSKTEKSIKQGKRLKECRNLRGYTQQEFADLVGYESVNSITYYETGIRSISWNTAHLLAEKLSVNPAYLMCESDSIRITNTDTEKNTNNTIDRCVNNMLLIDETEKADDCMLKLLMHLGISVNPGVEALYGDMPDELKEGGEVSIEWSIDDPHCYITSDIGTKHEGIVTDVRVGNTELSHGMFKFVVNRVYDYIRFTFGELKHFQNDYYFCHGEEYAIQDEIGASRNPMSENTIDGVKALEKYAEMTAKGFYPVIDRINGETTITDWIKVDEPPRLKTDE